MKIFLIPMMLIVSALPLAALDSSDLLFHLSFENGAQPEFARGGSQPITVPDDLQGRLVDGLWSKGYLFGSKKCSIENLYKICKVLNISLPEFFGGEATDLPEDLLELLRLAKKLSKEERTALNIYIQHTLFRKDNE